MATASFLPPYKDKEDRREEEREELERKRGRNEEGEKKGWRKIDERKGKVIKVRGEGERMETPLNKSKLPGNLSVSRLLLLVTEDQQV